MPVWQVKPPLLPHVLIDVLDVSFAEPEPAATVLGDAGAGIAVAADEYDGATAEMFDDDGSDDPPGVVAETTFDASSVSKGAGS
jgi:hypothetical protein